MSGILEAPSEVVVVAVVVGSKNENYKGPRQPVVEILK